MNYTQINLHSRTRQSNYFHMSGLHRVREVFPWLKAFVALLFLEDLSSAPGCTLGPSKHCITPASESNLHRYHIYVTESHTDTCTQFPKSMLMFKKPDLDRVSQCLPKVYKNRVLATIGLLLQSSVAYKFLILLLKTYFLYVLFGDSYM